ncbi:MAG TPA: TonB-dependent receptor plug domain-containing protein, partial [Bacteroidia bacterium]|nr:TonB-dependent receptor plug domain-containing protein [Bacteroidia bacterium]
MRCVVFVILLVLTFSLSAQQDSSARVKDFSELSLEELLNTEVYSASKTMQRTDEAPAIISSIQLNQLKTMGAVTLIDALKYIPSVEVSMGVNGFYRVAIRGMRKDGNILLLVDGQPLNDFYSGVAIFDLLIDFIDRVEIIRGPGSAIYGSNAMAGVINVITIKKNSISASGGINNTVKVGVNLYKEKNKFSVATSLAGYMSAGANSKIDTDIVKTSAWSLTNGNKTFTTNRWNKDLYFNTNIAYGNLHLKVFDIARQQGMWAGPLYVATDNSNLFTNQVVASVDYDY